MDGKIQLVLLISLFTGPFIEAQLLGNQIYTHINHCYRGNETQPWIGNSFQLLLELLRKIEDAHPTSMDIRRYSVNLIHRIRVDGIERSLSAQETEFVTPYGVFGRMASKYSILLQLISDIPGKIEFSNFLTQDEICNFHRIISTTVEPYSRGDEIRTCPLTLLSGSMFNRNSWNLNEIKDPSTSTRTVTSNSISRCPIEKGVIRTNNYGTISPGTLIASIAAGLQPQTVAIREFLQFQHSINSELFDDLEDFDEGTKIEKREISENLSNLMSSLDSIKNTYAAGLVGDLSEVCVFQGPIHGENLTVGLPGAWNSSIFPRVRYFPQNHLDKWDMTDSEILTGIDSIFISQQVAKWTNRLARIRLSQIFDMYYSSRGIPIISIENIENRSQKRYYTGRRKFTNKNSDNNNEFEEMNTWHDRINRGCNRLDILNGIDIAILKEETFHFSQILQLTTTSVSVNNDILRRNCDLAVDKFFDYARILLDTLPSCNQISKDYKTPSVDLSLIIDGSRREYENLELINYMSESIDVSTYNSYISVIHGTTGEILTNRTKSISDTFSQLRNYTGAYPTTLSLPRVLSTLTQELSNQSETEQRERILAGPSKVILIMSQSERMTQNDFESARRMLNGTFLQFPDLYFIFITNDPETFRELASELNDDHKNQVNRYTVINSVSVDPTTFTQGLVDLLKKIPKRIMSPFCRVLNDSRNNGFFRDEYEEYLSPGIEINYRVAPFYLRGTSNVGFEFDGFGYGDFTVCISRMSNYSPLECKTVTDLQTAEFNVTNPCPNVRDCAGIYFSVNMDSSLLRCTENECRYPDQIRYMIRHRGLRCQYASGGNKPIILTNIFFKIIFITIAFYTII